MSIETPKYEVLKRDGMIEIRRYESYISANVTVRAPNRVMAAFRGFSPLANYIFGGNAGSGSISMTASVTAAHAPEKIAMTAPVTIGGKSEHTVSFTMPGSYTLESLPKPLDKRVQFEEHPPKTCAAIYFSGFFSESNFRRHEARLRRWMTENRLEPDGDALFAGYDPPFKLWFLKHNEVIIPLMV